MKKTNRPLYALSFQQYIHLLCCSLFTFLFVVEGQAQNVHQSNDKYIQFFSENEVELCHANNNLRHVAKSLVSFWDETGTLSFDEVLENQHLFEKAENESGRSYFDSEKAYWVKVDIQARKSHQDSMLIFTHDFFSLQGWEYVDAYMVHENGDREHQKTGFSVPSDERTIDHAFQPVAFGLHPNEQAALYFRFEKNRQSKVSRYFSNWNQNLIEYFYINVWIKNISELTSPYKFDGTYYERSTNRPFQGNTIFQFDLFRDTTAELDVSYIHNNSASISWEYADTIVADLGEVYWMKRQLLGSELFNGEHLFHVSSIIGHEDYSFHQMDIYIPDKQGGFDHQQTGHGVRLADRPIDFWASFFKVDLNPADTVDVYIRLEGLDPYISMGPIFMYHIDPTTVFESQFQIAIKRSLFLGVMGIQFMLFLSLFFIERARIHFFFSLLILGQILTFVFTPENYASYVLFAGWRQFELPLFYLGIFLTCFGMLHFAADYFDYAANSIYRKWILPLFLIPLGICCLYGFFPPHGFYYSQRVLLFSVLMIPIFLIMALRAKHQPKYLKTLFIVAFIPVSLVFIRLVGYNWDIFPQYENLYNYEKLSMILDWVSMAMVFTLWLLGFSIGFRNKLLKNEKAKMEQQNAESKRILFEKEVEAEQLQKMDAIKTKLFTNITHEFRTPLTVIMGINDELVKQPYIQKLSKAQKSKVELNHKLISRNSKNLLNLISQLLDLSKVDSGALDLRNIQDNIIPYLNYLTESFYSRANGKNIRLVFYSELKELVMDFDESKIQHIIYNLISNAIKFTGNDGKIVLHAKQEILEGKPCLKLVVSDNGIGIPKKKLPHIFDRFYQVENSNTRTGEGTGIGLALVKELVELMKGNIEVASTLGLETTFTIYLPITREAPRVKLIESNSTLTDNLATEILEPTYLEEELIIGSDVLPLVLVVEDNADVTQYIIQILEKEYQVVTAKNGAIGMEKAFQYIPDLIISDVMMPEVDGNVLTTTLKKDNRTNHIPIILLTAKSKISDKVEGIKSGADAFLSKPFNKEELMSRISQLLALRKTLQERYANENLTEAAIDSELKQIPILSKENLFLMQLQKVVSENLENTELNVEYLAKAFGLSTSQLYRKVKALTDDSPNVFIRNVRLKKGLLLLKTTELNVSQIAYAIGFNDPGYFSKSFHKLYGKSPLSFRK